MTPTFDIAAIVPCYNEEASVAAVVTDLRRVLPEATVYVYDNNSSDQTAGVAAAAGAVVRTEPRKGKGNVLRRAFADIDADVYLLIDGDNTYDATAARLMVDTLLSGPYDQVVGARRQVTDTAYRPGHAMGNRLLTGVVAAVFGSQISDMLSGYRVFSRRYVKSFPALSAEFETETEMTVHALSLRLPVTEVEVGFKDRPEGSESKLRTYRDGWRILRWIVRLIQHEKPVLFYGFLGLILSLAALLLGAPVLLDYLDTGLVPRLPTAILATGLSIIAVLCFAAGLVLNSVTRARAESARLAYLRLPAPVPPGARRSDASVDNYAQATPLQQSFPG